MSTLVSEKSSISFLLNTDQGYLWTSRPTHTKLRVCTKKNKGACEYHRKKHQRCADDCAIRKIEEKLKEEQAKGL